MRWTRDFDYTSGLDIERPNPGTTPGTREGWERGQRALETGRVEIGNQEFEGKHRLLAGTTRVPSGTVVGPWKTA